MAPAAWQFCVTFIAVIRLSFSTDHLLKMECKGQHKSVFGQDTKLECFLKSPYNEFTIIKLLWKKENTEDALFKFFSGMADPGNDPRFERLQPGNCTDVSLLVKNTKITDEGKYTCLAVTDRGHAIAETILSVSAPYTNPVMSSMPAKNIRDDMTVTMFCNVSGGYPEGRIQWYDEYNTDWTRSSETQSVQTKDRRYNLTSTFTVTASSTTKQYSCSVFNSDDLKEGEQELNLMFGPDKQEGDSNTTAVAAVFVVVGALASGILVLALLRRRRLRGPPLSHPVETEEPLEVETK
ncbi:CD276 antigen homolog [Amia ocellicauda]|uniref:CD276 antigen homolog n=1 Tax=Amia ocellicauda TaxID=2972642 RepID=UPI0034647DCB